MHKMNDGNFSFWCARDGGDRRCVIFRVREDIGNNHDAAIKRYREKKLDGVFERGVTIQFRPATDDEIDWWMDSHEGYYFVLGGRQA